MNLPERGAINMKIFVFAGHGKSDTGGYDSGAVGNGYHEFNLNKEIAKRTSEALQQYKEVNAQCHNYDGTMNLKQRIAFANANLTKTDLVLEIHQNSASTVGVGTETYYYTGDPVGQKVADCVSKEISANLNIVERAGGDRPTTYFGIVRETKATALLVETCFINNPAEVNKINDTNEQIELGKAIARGIAKAYGLTIKAQPTPQPTHKYKTGDIVTVSSFYPSNLSTMGFPPKGQAVSADYRGKINAVVGGNNPYALDNGKFCNDGDIRELNPKPVAPANKLTIKAGTWYIRTEPKATSKIIRTVIAGEVYTSTKSTNDWYYIDSLGGWISKIAIR